MSLKSNIAHANQLWSHTLIASLVKLGVIDFFIAPGSRSSLLAYAIADNPKAKSLVHFDERGLAFFALGHAKATKKPCAILVTSGSAVGNLLPAIMEADQSQIPLLILTADRPPEHIDIGANQTTNQVHIFSAFVREEYNLPTPSIEVPLSYLAKTLAHAVMVCSCLNPGPVHINCPFRRPLFDGSPFQEIIDTPVPYYASLSINEDTTLLESLGADLLKHEGLIVLGEGAITSPEEAEAVEELAGSTYFPIYADVQSGFRSFGRKKSTIPYVNHFLKAKQLKAPTAILHIGGRLISREAMLWFASLDLKYYVQVSSSLKRIDPQFLVTHRLTLSTLKFCRAMRPFLPQKPLEFSYVEAYGIMQNLLEKETKLAEMVLVHTLSECLPSHSAVFFASSMPVRDGDHFFYPKNEDILVFSARGVSGIDGNIATSCGLARSLQRPLVAVVGDLATLHDLNSFSLASKQELAILFLIINNQGGGLFSFLPHIKESPYFEEYIAKTHPFEFSSIATMFGLEYKVINEVEPLKDILSSFFQDKKSLFVEIKTEREENYRQHQEIEKIFAQELACCMSSVVAR